MRQSKIKYVVTLVLLAGVITAASIASMAHITRAASGTNGTPTKPANPPQNGCGESLLKDHPEWAHGLYDTCYGYTWRKYDATSDSIDIPAGNYIGGGTVHGCAEHGQYYRLGFGVYDATTGPNYISKGNQVGLEKVSVVSKRGFTVACSQYSGNVCTKYVSEQWNDVLNNFRIAESKGVTFGYSWEDTAWFCWSDDWVEEKTATGTFVAISSVRSGDNHYFAETGPDGTDETGFTYVMDSDQDSVTLNFSHQLQYTPPNPAIDNIKGTNFPVQWYGQNASGGSANSRISTPLSYANSAFAEDVHANSVTVNKSDIEAAGGSKKYCSDIKYSPKTFTFSSLNPFTSSGDGYSKICATVSYSKPSLDDAYEGHFWSSSTVKIPNTIDGISYASVGTSYNSNDKAGDSSTERSVVARISTNSEKITVNFSHQLHYYSDYVEDDDEKLSNGSTAPKVSVNYYTKGDSSEFSPSQTSSKSSWETYSYKPSGTDSSSISSVISSQTLTVPAGGEAWACSTINYDPRTITVERQEVTSKDDDDSDDDDDGGSGTSSGGGDDWAGVCYDLGSDTYYEDAVKYASSKVKSCCRKYNDGDIGYLDLGNYPYRLYNSDFCEERYASLDPVKHNIFGNIAQTSSNTKANIFTPPQSSFSSLIARNDDDDGDGEGGTKKKTYKYKLKNDDGDPQGSGWSQACVVVARPDNDRSYGKTDSASDSANKIFYAGETGNYNWDGWAKSIPEDRLVDYQIVDYVLQPNVNSSAASAAIAGASLSRSEVSNIDSYTPCQFIQSKISTYRCSDRGTIGRDNSARTNKATYYVSSLSPHKTQNSITVPDFVGAKYCNTFAFRWQRYRGVKYSNSSQINYVGNTSGFTWDAVPNSSLWRIFGSSCSAVAKKPSVAIWNGGIFASGSILTSSSPRSLLSLRDTSYHPANTVNKQTFGSWTEFVAASRDQIKNFASGAALSRGSNNAIYPLTISNTNPSDLGKSNISASSTFISRLGTYLTPNSSSSDLYGTGDLTFTGGTHIYEVSGGFTLEKNIITSGSPSSIYEIPRVIIFVRGGDLNIAPGVTRVDAWLIIADGTVNTCAGFNATVSTKAEGISTAAVCDAQLQINGPVVAKGVNLRRTYGSDPIVYSTASDRYTPAEIFNLSVDDYLWAYAQAGRYESSYTDAYTRELPPRY